MLAVIETPYYICDVLLFFMYMTTLPYMASVKHAALLQNILVQEHSDVTLLCATSRQGGIIWSRIYRNRQRETKVDNLSPGNGRFLKLNNIRIHDEGIYQCQDITGIISRYNLTVFVIPTLLHLTIAKELQRDGTTVLSCCIPRIRPANIVSEVSFWFRISNGPSYSISDYNSTVAKNADGTLNLKALLSVNSKSLARHTVSCNVTWQGSNSTIQLMSNTIAVRQSNHTLQIQANPNPAKEGENVTLKCKMNKDFSEDLSVYLWSNVNGRKNLGVITSNGHLLVSASRSTAGNYCCDVSKHKQDTASTDTRACMELKVYYKPEIAVRTMPIPAIVGRQLQVMCSVTGGNSPISNISLYHVTGLNKKVLLNSSNFYHLENLTERIGGRILCEVLTSAGLSAVSTRILVKNYKVVNTSNPIRRKLLSGDRATVPMIPALLGAAVLPILVIISLVCLRKKKKTHKTDEPNTGYQLEEETDDPLMPEWAAMNDNRAENPVDQTVHVTEHTSTEGRADSQVYSMIADSDFIDVKPHISTENPIYQSFTNHTMLQGQVTQAVIQGSNI